jgi:DNA-binding NarL/FixJ family response regulator
MSEAMAVRVVLADDHPIVLGGLAQLLSLESDIEIVAQCTSAGEALAAVRRERADIVVADLTMPGRSGLDLARDVGAASLPVRVVLLTARIEGDQVIEALRLGVAGIILKETAPTQILDCIRRVAEGQQWIDPIVGRKTLDGVLRRESGHSRAASLLTPREIEVVRMVAEGHRNKEIADALFISEGTVKAHLRTIFEKLGISSRMKLILYARENSLV